MHQYTCTTVAIQKCNLEFFLSFVFDEHWKPSSFPMLPILHWESGKQVRQAETYEKPANPNNYSRHKPIPTLIDMVSISIVKMYMLSNIPQTTAKSDQ